MARTSPSRRRRRARSPAAGRDRRPVAGACGDPADRDAARLAGAPPVGYPCRNAPERGRQGVFLPLAGLLLGVLAGLVLNVNVGFEFTRYSAVAILAALDSVLGAVRAELDGVYDNRIFISGFITNAIVAVLLTFIAGALRLGSYVLALITSSVSVFS